MRGFMGITLEPKVYCLLYGLCGSRDHGAISLTTIFIYQFLRL